MTKTTTFQILSIISVGVLASFSLYAQASSGEALNRVPGKYIVVLKDGNEDADTAVANLEKRHGVSEEERYTHALRGFSASLSDAKVRELKDDPQVAFISEDRTVSIDGQPGNAITQVAQTIPTGINRIGAVNLSNKGTGIGVAIIDTGIDLTHPDLAANISPSSKSCVTGVKNGQDDNGHGTHVSGTIAALNNSIGVVGVAPEAKLVAVKVLNKSGSGTWSSIICGIDWVTANAQNLNIKVANMSLGGAGTSDNNCGATNNDALHAAICRSTAKGITYVVAAGNDGANASASVPSAYNDTVITVSALADSDGKSGGLGASTSYGTDDTFATFSNYGSAVDIGAPGVNILSTWKGGAYNMISGTSMATPHVTGAAALFLKANPTATWTQVRDGLRSLGEALGAGHTDPSALHSEPMLKASSF
jgi:subtilisin